MARGDLCLRVLLLMIGGLTLVIATPQYVPLPSGPDMCFIGLGEDKNVNVKLSTLSDGKINISVWNETFGIWIRSNCTTDGPVWIENNTSTGTSQSNSTPVVVSPGGMRFPPDCFPTSTPMGSISLPFQSGRFLSDDGNDDGNRILWLVDSELNQLKFRSDQCATKEAKSSFESEMCIIQEKPPTSPNQLSSFQRIVQFGWWLDDLPFESASFLTTLTTSSLTSSETAENSDAAAASASATAVSSSLVSFNVGQETKVPFGDPRRCITWGQSHLGQVIQQKSATRRSGGGKEQGGDESFERRVSSSCSSKSFIKNCTALQDNCTQIARVITQHATCLLLKGQVNLSSVMQYPRLPPGFHTQLLSTEEGGAIDGSASISSSLASIWAPTAFVTSPSILEENFTTCADGKNGALRLQRALQFVHQSPSDLQVFVDCPLHPRSPTVRPCVWIPPKAEGGYDNAGQPLEKPNSILSHDEQIDMSHIDPILLDLNGVALQDASVRFRPACSRCNPYAGPHTFSPPILFFIMVSGTSVAWLLIAEVIEHGIFCFGGLLRLLISLRVKVGSMVVPMTEEGKSCTKKFMERSARSILMSPPELTTHAQTDVADTVSNHLKTTEQQLFDKLGEESATNTERIFVSAIKKLLNSSGKLFPAGFATEFKAMKEGERRKHARKNALFASCIELYRLCAKTEIEARQQEKELLQQQRKNQQFFGQQPQQYPQYAPQYPYPHQVGYYQQQQQQQQQIVPNQQQPGSMPPGYPVVPVPTGGATFAAASPRATTELSETFISREAFSSKQDYSSSEGEYTSSTSSDSDDEETGTRAEHERLLQGNEHTSAPAAGAPAQPSRTVSRVTRETMDRADKLADVVSKTSSFKKALELIDAYSAETFVNKNSWPRSTIFNPRGWFMNLQLLFLLFAFVVAGIQAGAFASPVSFHKYQELYFRLANSGVVSSLVVNLFYFKARRLNTLFANPTRQRPILRSISIVMLQPRMMALLVLVSPMLITHVIPGLFIYAPVHLFFIIGIAILRFLLLRFLPAPTTARKARENLHGELVQEQRATLSIKNVILMGFWACERAAQIFVATMLIQLSFNYMFLLFYSNHGSYPWFTIKGDGNVGNGIPSDASSDYLSSTNIVFSNEAIVRYFQVIAVDFQRRAVACSLQMVAGVEWDISYSSFANYVQNSFLFV